MGVPKFFRYMSERYPCLSEVVHEYQIPEFDNLYLDMNGIIHNCSHPNDNDVHFRITEKQIFQDIFHYLEILFRMIQPKKLFFMAIDGVAPRAKMNQQRGRRFRSAKEAEVLEQKAREKGEELPTEKRFDSNCITPGTPFMYRLHQQLRYFVKLKVTTDKLWKDTCVILSGHETPGEGEHKIMDYIRYMKSKPDYNPNLRHCLYGLDADLIMLGLCTHEPYFCLLREEVKFNTKSNKGGSQKLIVTPEETKFFLLHLSLLRDYLALEFGKLKQPGVLSFPFDIEKIIDDWVLMGFLIGNDFIPNLPDLHIINGALPLMYKVYQEVLPTLDGYMNEGGHLNLKRFEKFMAKLASFDFEQFREKYADIQYLEGKTGKKFSETFYKEKNMDPDLAALIKATDDDFDYDDVAEEILNYADYEEYYYSDENEEWRQNFFSEFGQHKTDYYHHKLDYAKVTNEVLRDQAECYIRAIQWNLNYYYNGCVSWSWYYPHHYAPYISDIKDFAHLNIKFEMGEPFLPFQQLLAVLPAASKELLPAPYQDLMTSETSPILEYYPVDFETDLNGKKQDWEAVVLIPFIDEVKLIKAMDSVEHLLTNEERLRNRHGPMMVYTYTNQNLGIVMAPEHFPYLQENHAIEKPIYRDDIYVHPSKLKKGLCKNVNLNLYQTQFHSLKHVKFTHKIENAKVKVFQQPSRNESVIIVQDKIKLPDLKSVANQILGKNIFINYPHLVEIRVQAVSTKEMRISFDKNTGFVYEKPSKELHDRFLLSKKSITDEYFSKLGIDIGNTEILVYGQPVETRKYFFGPRGNVTQQKTYIRHTSIYAYQTAVLHIQQTQDSLEYKTIDEIFYPGCQCFTLSNPHYGSEGCVICTVKDDNSYIKLSLKVQQEPDLQDLVHLQDETTHTYLPGYNIASKLSISPLLLSRFTGSIFIVDGIEDGGKRHNIGLNIKFSKKNEEVVGFTRRDEYTKRWFFTEKVVTLIRDYMKNFPEVFEFLKDHQSDDIYVLDEVFPYQGAQRVAQIVNWLKEQPHAKAEVRTCGAAVVDEKVVKLIEERVDSCEKAEKRMTLLVKPNKLYIPKPTLDKVCPDHDTKFELFDRVVNIRDCYTVPLGYRGTVIGVIQGETSYDTMYDVVFDKPFPHGVKIRCTEERGYRMAAQAMINLSYGERLCGNGTAYPKNVNVMRSRADRNGSYAQTTRQQVQETSRTFFKQNSPPVILNSQNSPYHMNVSQQSSASRPPSSAMMSQQSSPFTVKPRDKPQQAKNVNQTVVKSMVQESQPKPQEQTVKSRHKTQQAMNVNETIVKSVVQENKTIVTSNVQETQSKPQEQTKQKVVFNKETRCIFSNATPSIPSSQSSELFSTGGMSFFGYSNLLDKPETKNKLLTGDITSNKFEEKEAEVSKENFEESTIETKKVNTSEPTNVYQSEVNVSKETDTKYNIPSITDLIKQNNITAKSDYTASGNFQDMMYVPTTSESSTPDSSFTTKLTNLFNRSNPNETEAENTFKRAISAMVQQSPQLLEKQEEHIIPPHELSFNEKHAPLNKSDTPPTIKTEMRKIIPSFDYQTMEGEDEEEVMIIELNREAQKIPDPIEQRTVQPANADPFQEFLSKLKSNNHQTQKDESTGTIPTEQAKSAAVANINAVTADTINEFFVEASRRQELGEPGSITDDKSSNASDMLKKMLNIESMSNLPVELETRSLPEGPNILNLEQIEQQAKPLSAFSVVKSSGLSDQNQSVIVAPPNASLSSVNRQKILNPCVPCFIPPQVQKHHINKIKPLDMQSFQQNLEHLTIGDQPKAPERVPLVRPQPGPLQMPPNGVDLAYPVQSSNVPAPHMRGIPILGAQAPVYKQPYQQQYPTQPLYYNQQPRVYYPQAPYQPIQQPYNPNTTPQQYFPLQSQAQMIPQPQPVPWQSAQGVFAAQTSSKSQQSIYPTSQSQQGLYPNSTLQQKLYPIQKTPTRQGYPTPTPQQSVYQSQTSQFPQSSSQFGPFTPKPGPGPAPGQFPSSTNLEERKPQTTNLEERTDTYYARLAALTRAHNLGAPDYSYVLDANKNFVASVRISHPHSEIIMRGKPCAKKSDSVEICARRAYNELKQIYPSAQVQTSAFQSDVIRPEANRTPLAETTQTEVATEANTSIGSVGGESGNSGKKKGPRIAAKFNVPLKPKN